MLGHEIAHVTRKHTINAIRKNNAIKLGSDQAGGRAALIAAAANAVYDNIIENAYDRGDELDADKVAVEITQKAGYKPSTLGDFLKRLAERNNSQKERNGLFASHPETKERITRIGQLAASGKAVALVEARYRRPTSSTDPADITSIARGRPRARRDWPGRPRQGAGKEGRAQERAARRCGALNEDGRAGEADRRRCRPQEAPEESGADRAAKGGSNPNMVKVSVSASEINAFKKGIV